MTRPLLLIVLGVCTLAHAAPPQLSDHMSLADIGAAMDAYPPRWEFGDQRALITASLDKHVTIQVRKEMTDDDRARLQPLRDFYLSRVRSGLDKLESTRVTSGVHAFKFYSSSYIFKTPAGVVAVEFAQGPVNNSGEPEERDQYRAGFYWPPDLRDRLARLVDVQIITHWHHDHADFSLAKRLAARGKTVVGPAQLKTIWKDFADRITVPDFGNVQTFGPVQVYAFLGAQYGTNKPTGNGSERIGVPHPDGPTRDSQTIAYLFKLNGITFTTAGENHVPATDWLRRGIELGFKPSVRMSLGQFQGDRAMVQAVKDLKLNLFRLPLHEYEMMHDGGGNRTGPLMLGSSRAMFDKHQMMPMLWGEDFLITDDTVAFTR